MASIEPTMWRASPINSIDVETLFTILFVEIDDWYQLKGRQWLRGKVARPAKFSDSEVMTFFVPLLWGGYSQFSMDIFTIQSYLLRICTKFI